MLFGDEERFSKPMTPTKRDGQVYAVKVSQNTDEFIGPGSYYKNDVEEQRGGWQKKSFSRREPMTPSSKEKANGLNRSDFYTHGVMTSYGAMAMPTHSPKRPSPGPGYYEKDIIRSPSSRSVSCFPVLVDIAIVTDSCVRRRFIHQIHRIRCTTEAVPLPGLPLIPPPS